MRHSFAAAVFITVSAVGNAAGHNILSALAPHVPSSHATVLYSTPASSPSSPVDRLDIRLRQAPDLVPVAAPLPAITAPAVPAAAPPAGLDPPAEAPPAVVPPAVVPPAVVPPAVDPAAVPAPAPAVAIPPVHQEIPPAPSVAILKSVLTTSTLPLLPTVTGDELVTVQWVETRIGKLRTWVPKTYTFHFEAMSQAPLPGVGSIGMGTLTGTTGQTQTIYIVAAAAPTSAVDAKKVAVVAMAAGVAGLVV